MKKKRHPHLVKQYTMIDEMMVSATWPVAPSDWTVQASRLSGLF